MSILKNINYIKKLSLINCSSPDIFVLVETGFAAAVPALLTLGVPGCTDIVKMKLGISPWHARGIRTTIKGVAAPFSKSANSFLYKIGYFTAERGLYYLMVADVATQFVATWQSLIYVAEQCQLPSAGTSYGGIAPFIYGPGQLSILQPTEVNHASGVNIGLGTITILPGFQGSVAFSCSFDSWPTRGQGADASTWMTEDSIPTPISFSRTNNPPSQPKNQTAGSTSFDTTRAVLGKRYTLHVQINGDTNTQVVAGSYSVALQGNRSPVLPWGCNFKPTSIPFT